MKLKNKVAVVTGAAGGLGKAIAVAMAKEGASVVACDVNEQGLAAAAKEAGAECAAHGATCMAVRCDVSSSADVARMFRDAAERFGTVHVLVNNAALVPSRPEDEVRRRRHYDYLTTPVPRRSLELTSSLTDEDWHRYWGVNVHGVFYCTREALRLMEPRREGKIVNIASVAGISAYSAHSPHYTATKGAVVAFTRAVALDVAGANIFVNAIAPGGVLTPDFAAYMERSSEAERNRFNQLVPLGRLGTVEEYASLAVYLASDGHYLVGQIISPNGGLVI
ncbi:MAG TPA: SDR family oxidoreductase [Steroidobacteraceae bacterium]|nr:SDR family oxidoreductase [Steroidobacteraceae bacterium]